MDTLVGSLHWLLTAAWLAALWYCLPLYRLRQLPEDGQAGYFAAWALIRTTSLVPLAAGVACWLMRSQDSREVVTSWGTTFQTGLFLAFWLVINQWFLIRPQEERLKTVTQDDPQWEEITRRLFLGARFSLVLGAAALVFLGAALVLPFAPDAGSKQLGNYWALVVLWVSLFEGMAWFLENDAPMRRPISMVIDSLLLTGLLLGSSFIA